MVLNKLALNSKICKLNFIELHNLNLKILSANGNAIKTQISHLGVCSSLTETDPRPIKDHRVTQNLVMHFVNFLLKSATQTNELRY